MKKIVIIITSMALVLVSSCNKELSKEIDQPANQGIAKQELMVSISDYIDVETKATISSEGAFSWDGDEEIAVIDNKGVTHKYTYDRLVDGKACFVTSDVYSDTPVSAVYPYTVDGSQSFPTTVDGPNGALDNASIRLTGTITDNAVTLSHTNALMKVSFDNAPTFASVIVFEGNGETVTVSNVNPSVRGTISAYIPVPADTYTFTISLKDDNGNTIVSKSKGTAKVFTAGYLHKMQAVSVDGWVFIFNSASGADQLRVFKTDGTTIVYDDANLRYYVTLNALSGSSNNKWGILPSNLSWTSKGSPVCVQAFNNGSYVSATDCIYLYRDFVFDFSSSSMKTTYRSYFKVNNSSWASDASANIKDGYNEPKDFTAMTAVSGETKFWYYEWPASYYGYGMHIIMQNASNTAWLEPSSGDWSYTLNRDCMYTKN